MPRATGATTASSSSLQGTSFYFIDIIYISVGGRQLSIGQSVFQTAGTIIDSGTVITRLFFGVHRDERRVSDDERVPDKYTNITIPTISFTFGGNLKVDLDLSEIFVAVNSTIACLAFAGNRDASDVGIFGNTQQKTLEVVYDVVGGKLGFDTSGCN
ncbi:hypothetical protein DH2020_024709 [Rehmannia glutinosa]|uniref:Peptidase A1 domain-containing protein n=1 Tax=Rehmannia glutinosa TaxID=99300 RepID=A0ABR0W3K1_REHGL